MKNHHFKPWHAQAIKEGVKNNPLFNCAGYFWLDLTPRQASAMIDILRKEEAKEDDHYIYLTSGLGISTAHAKGGANHA